jgi:diguanylate cyclase (GGDEF)-like protein
MRDETYLDEQMRLFGEFTQGLEDVRRRAAVDALTGLASRRKAEAFLHNRLQAANRITILLVDLNGFKRINQQWGHECGDQILTAVGELLAEACGNSDLVCRWAGDKFLPIWASGLCDAEAEARRLRKLVSREYQGATAAGSFAAPVSASVGCAQANEGDTLADLLARAEMDLHNDKARARHAS